MMRHLMIAGVLFGLSNTAQAETPDDKPAEFDEISLADTDIESADKRNRGGSARNNSGRSSSSSAASRPASSSSTATRSGTASRPATTTRSGTASRPATTTRSGTASRPATTTRSGTASRPATTTRSGTASRPATTTRSGTASRPATTTRSGTASRPATATRSGSAQRPHNAGRGGARPAGSRPSHRVYHPRWAPKRWSPSYHRYHIRGVPRYHPRYWSAGVFVYNPPPPRHRVVVVERTVTGENVGRTEAPKRAINRNGDFGFGMRAGSYMSGYENGGGYGDMGLGITAEFRPVESVGLTASWDHYNQSWEDGTQRANNPLQASVNLYAFPWARVSPYGTVGLTWNSRQINDTYTDDFTGQTTVATVEDTLFGPHAGLGLQFAIGDNAAVNFEGRFVNYLSVDVDDPSVPSAVQGNMGLNFYF